MDSETITELYASLLLDEEPPPVVAFSEELISPEIERLRHCLVVKILTSKPINKEAFRSTMLIRAWKTKMNTAIESLGENRFICHFNSDEDKWRIIADGPWCFSRALVAMEQPNGLGDLARLKFQYQDFWVQIHNVPLLCISESMCYTIGKMIGEVRDIDLGPSGACLGRYLQVQVKGQGQNDQTGHDREKWVELENPVGVLVTVTVSAIIIPKL